MATLNLAPPKAPPVPAQRTQRPVQRPVQRAAANRTRAPQRPAQRPQRPAQRPQQRPQQNQHPSLLNMSPAQIEARARQIVGKEVEAERLPFQQRQQTLNNEQAGVTQAHVQNYGQLDATLGKTQEAQSASAKTFENTAAQMVKDAQSAAPGATEAAEHLGGTPNPESATARQEQAARTLLTGIATAAQSGTNARQQAEADFLTNTRATSAESGVAGSDRIASEYGKRKQEEGNKEAQVVAGKPGRVGKLTLGLEGEQAKLRTAAQALGLKFAQEQSKERTERTNENLGRGRLSVQQANSQTSRENAQTNRAKGEADIRYKEANQSSKATKDRLDIQKKQLDIKSKLQAPGGKPLTKVEKDAYSSEMAQAFNAYRRAREEGASPAEVRKGLENGYFHREAGKKDPKTEKAFNEKIVKIKNPTFIQAAEDIMQKEYISAPVKQQLREMGIRDSGWSNQFLGAKSTPNRRSETAHMGR